MYRRGGVTTIWPPDQGSFSLFEIMKFIAETLKSLIPALSGLKKNIRRKDLAVELVDLYLLVNECVINGQLIIDDLEGVLSREDDYAREHGVSFDLANLTRAQLGRLSAVLKKIMALRAILELFDPTTERRLASLVGVKVTALELLRKKMQMEGPGEARFPGWAVDPQQLEDFGFRGFGHEITEVDFVPVPLSGRMTSARARELGLHLYLEDARRRIGDLATVSSDFRLFLLQFFSADELLATVGTGARLGWGMPFMDERVVMEITSSKSRILRPRYRLHSLKEPPAEEPS